MDGGEIGKLLKSVAARLTCKHAGEDGDFCGACGADLRPVSGYQCRVCDLKLKNRVYPLESTPDFCRSCGAPRFTFKPVRKSAGGMGLGTG